MVQVLEANPRPLRPRKLSFMDKLGLGLSEGLKAGLTEFEKKQAEERQFARENTLRAMKNHEAQDQDYRQKQQIEQGLEQVQNIFSDPNLSAQQKQIALFKAMSGSPEVAKILGSQLAGMEGQQQKSVQDSAVDQQRYDVIERNFGKRAAELYRAAPEGGKTNFIDKLLESRQRGQTVEDLLGQPYDDQQLSNSNQYPTFEESEKLSERPAIKAIDYDRGLTPKERVRRQDDRYGKNLPLYQESQKKMHGLESERDSLNTLAELSPQIGALQRLNINPENGELLIPALASPEAQRFVKTVNDFTVKAKDSYGSRVSNFELDRFMKRLPTLANSQEGRSQIIRQMQIINDINTSREQNLQDVIDEHGGIRNIDYDKAERIADKQSKGQIEALKKEYRSIDSNLDRQYQQKIKEKKKALVPPGRVAIEKDGKIFSIPSKQLKVAIKKGYKPV